MTDENLIDRLAVALAARVAPALPVAIDLWNTALIGAYLKRSADHVRKEILCLPTFPKPIRLPVEGKLRAQPLYRAREVVKWAESLS
ncbi:hypothetical protein [Janthinobacterium sp. CG_S6]|uniref:hypothetical protein n=1 Tax=Janthinobacterium sp. CG_S6 TaxID=3071707 RepID=UPI002DFCBCD9|nr:hypothetical protein [Janthinobacterium sp. CG_S6]